MPVHSIRKKTCARLARFLVLICFLFAAGSRHSAFADEGGSGDGAAKRIFRVFGRGVVNLVALPLEIPRTFVEQKRTYPRVWLWRSVPASLGNVVERGVSALHDVALFPWYVNRQGGDEPLTKAFNLPDYPWQRGTKGAGEEPERLPPVITSARG